MLGNDELCHPQDPQGEQLHVRPTQFCFLHPLLSDGAPIPLWKSQVGLLPALASAQLCWCFVVPRVLEALQARDVALILARGLAADECICQSRCNGPSRVCLSG